MSEQSDKSVTLEATPFSAPDASTRTPQKRLKPRHLGLIVASLCLAIFTWHLFTAKAISVTFTPEAKQTHLSGWLTFALGERYLVRPGPLTVTAQAEGHFPLEQIVTVTSESDQDFEFVFDRLPGQLEVNTEPKNASVSIDGKVVGTAPIVIEDVSAGNHTLTLTAPKYVPFTERIKIEGMAQTQRITKVLEPAWAFVSVSSQPSGGQLMVDGTAIGTLPLRTELEEGKRELQVNLAGYESKALTITVTRNIAMVLEPIVLQPAKAIVNLNSEPAGALVANDEGYLGTTPLRHAISPNTPTRFNLTKAGYEPASRTIALDPAESANLTVNLQPRLGAIQLQIMPASARVKIDNEILPLGITEVSLPTRPHRFEVSLEGYATEVKTLTPDPLLTQTLAIALLTKDEAKIQAIPEVVTSRIDYSLQRILPATIELGADRRDRGGRSNEIPRTVTLTAPYYLGVTEVTNGQYQQFDSSHNPGVLGRMLLTEKQRPVVGISWQQAIEFCNWLSDLDGLPRAYERKGEHFELISPRTHGYRLPTEAEWARAGRYAGVSAGGTGQLDQAPRFPWGDSLPPSDASVNLADSSATGFAPTLVADYSDGFRGPSPVAHFSANQLGIYDLAGNVSEWMHDRYSTARSPATAIDWMGPDTGSVYVIRGSSFLSGSYSELRWAYRDSGSDGRQDLGFRLARDIAPENRP